MKSCSYPILLLGIITLTSCGGAKMAMTTLAASESHLPPSTLSLSSSEFQKRLASTLISPAINLTVTKTATDTIEAMDIYEGKQHRHNFFFKRVWQEKTLYVIVYKEIKGTVTNGLADKFHTEYRINTYTSEAPNETYQQWRPTSPSKTTKLYLITQQINNYE